MSDRKHIDVDDAIGNLISLSASTVGGDVVAGDKITTCVNIINPIGNISVNEMVLRDRLTELLSNALTPGQCFSQGSERVNDRGSSSSTRMFLHYFDHYFLEMQRIQPLMQEIRNECRLATRLAILMSERVFLPASSYFESVLCRSTIDEFAEFFELGIIWLIGSATSAWEYRDNKLSEYSKTSKQYLLYSEGTVGIFPPFWSRSKSATQEITKGWLELVNNSSQFATLASTMRIFQVKNLEQRWIEIPARLEHLAFVVQHVGPLLFECADIPHRITKKLHHMINDYYFTGFCEELQAGVVRDLAYLRSPLPSNSYGRDLPYAKVMGYLVRHKLLDKVRNCSVQDLLSLKFSHEWAMILADIMCSEIASMTRF